MEDPCQKDFTNLMAFIWIVMFAAALLVMDCLDHRVSEEHSDRDHIQG